MSGKINTDVLVIGAGLSGAVTTLRLAQAGIKVTCLEQGGWQDPERYPGKNSHFELSAMGPWHANPNIRRNRVDYPIADTTSDIAPMLFNGVGGSTILYSAHWMRFLPSDFYVHSLDGVGKDWPINYEDLAPFYDRIEHHIGVSGIAGDPAYPDKPDYPMPPLPIGQWGERVAEAHHRLGWHWWPGANAINARDYDGRRSCVQRSTCRAGCNEGAKGTVDRTHWPKAEKLGAQLITNATVSKILTGPSGLAEGVLYHDSEGVEHQIGAGVIIMAAHAIGTPRLLLMSADQHRPQGLCNSSGLVGKNLMMHPLCRVVGFFDEPMMSWQGHWGQSIYSMEFAETDSSRDFVRGAKWNLAPSGGPQVAAMYPTDNAPDWGADIHHRVDKWLGRSAIWGMTAEDLPDPDNKVTLDNDLVDQHGNPAPRLHYRIDDNSRKMLAFMQDRAIESFETAGAYETDPQSLAPDTGWHALGTCRMGNDPDTSVVNCWNRSHDIANLYIVDGSSFVTSSSVNPSATIAALALRATEHLIEQRRHQKVAC
jgi:choline dehydrogenase-like flavoprotein